MLLPPAGDKAVLSCDQLARHNRLSARSKSPASRAKSFIENATVLDLGQIDDAIRFDFNVIGRQLGCKDGTLLGRKRGRGHAVERARPVDLGVIV